MTNILSYALSRKVLLTRRLRLLTRAGVAYVNSYASLRTPYAHMRFGSSLRQCLRNAYAIPTPAVFFDGPYSGASARLAPSLRRHGATLHAHVLLTPILTRGLRHTYATAFLTIKI